MNPYYIESKDAKIRTLTLGFLLFAIIFPYLFQYLAYFYKSLDLKKKKEDYILYWNDKKEVNNKITNIINDLSKKRTHIIIKAFSYVTFSLGFFYIRNNYEMEYFIIKIGEAISIGFLAIFNAKRLSTGFEHLNFFDAVIFTIITLILSFITSDFNFICLILSFALNPFLYYISLSRSEVNLSNTLDNTLSKLFLDILQDICSKNHFNFKNILITDSNTTKTVSLT